jgi:hypothetical protein
MLAMAFSLSLPSVLAQQTSITNVTFPKNILYDLEADSTDPPVAITATVSYTGAQPGYYLEVGVFQLDDGSLASGSGSVNPGHCIQIVNAAACTVSVKSPTGMGDFNFLVRSRPKKLWNLAIVAVLTNSSLGMFYDSESDYTFTIAVNIELTLLITAPDPVTITVDGMDRSQGAISLKLITGPHNVTMPDTVQLNNETRLKFERWSDGLVTANRTVLLNHYVDLQAIYVTQYSLGIESSAPVSGSGWYDQGTNAAFSVNSTMQPMDGVLGLLGGRLEFQGWYDQDRLITTSKTGSIEMNAPRLIQARWYHNYTIPAALSISLLLLACYRLLTQKRRLRQSKAKRRARRRSS